MALLALLFWGAVTLLTLFLLGIFLLLQNHSSYFQKHGIPYCGAGLLRVAPLLFGRSADVVKMEQEVYRDATRHSSYPLVGMTEIFGKSIIYVTSLDLMRSIYVKDFEHFVNRRSMPDTGSKYFKKMIMSTDNDEWKGLRGKLSPTFTTGRIRRMFQIFLRSSERLETYLQTQLDFPSKKSADLDFLQIFPKYAMDVIASCAFGIDSKSFEYPPQESSYFEKMAQRFGFKFSPKFLLKFAVMASAPKVASAVQLELFDKESQDYLAGVVKNVMQVRREKGERREDFLQLMMDIQEGSLKADEEASEVMWGSQEKGAWTKESSMKRVFDDDDVVANGMLFLSAGFDTTQSLLLMTLYALALEPEVQERLSQEVKEKVKENGGQLSYEAVSDMKYLDMVINETMRRYSPATRTERACTKDFPVPGTNFVIEKGSVIIIPIFGVHQDPRYYPDPEKFIPERFTAENKAKRHPYAFSPFGHGPRNCIGMRFALVKVKAVVAKLVESFQFAPCAQTQIPMEFDRQPVIKPKDGMWLKVTVRGD